MPWKWVILIAIVRVLFLLAPFLGVIKDFAIPKQYEDEVQDFARASACKAVLLSFPALQLINLLVVTEKNCSVGVAPFPLAVTFLLCVLIAWLLSFIRAHRYRGKKSFYWVVGVTVIDAVLTILVFPDYAGSFCQH
jgi:magnesium-transporting ATPase (P-type)